MPEFGRILLRQSLDEHALDFSVLQVSDDLAQVAEDLGHFLCNVAVRVALDHLFVSGQGLLIALVVVEVVADREAGVGGQWATRVALRQLVEGG